MGFGILQGILFWIDLFIRFEIMKFQFVGCSCVLGLLGGL